LTGGCSPPGSWEAESPTGRGQGQDTPFKVTPLVTYFSSNQAPPSTSLLTMNLPMD
jgi:hypothetical protein